MADQWPVGSPLWWVHRLYEQLLARRPVVEKSAEYYDGVHNLAFQSKKFRETFGGLFNAFADNWCEVVVNSCAQRLNIGGFRVGDDPKTDKASWDTWQRNDLDLQSLMAHSDALAQGASYVTVWYDDQGAPEITVDSAINTIVARHPKFRRRRLAGLRCWLDEYGFEHAELFLPDEVYLFRSMNKRDATQMPSSAGQTSWIPDPDMENELNVDGAMNNPLGVVPVLEVLNRPRLYVARRAGWGAHSDLAPIIPLQDAANKLLADMIIASEFGAFPQRWITGYEDDQTSSASERFKSGPGNSWYLEDADGKFGQFAHTDLTNYTQAIEMVVQHVASISATPPHYLNPAADRLSGESLKTAETGLVARCKQKIRAFSETWEEAMRISGAISNNQGLAEATAMETVWSDPEVRTEAEHVDATLKKMALGIPRQQLWQDLGYSPQQIDRFKAMELEDSLLGLPSAPAITGSARLGDGYKADVVATAAP